MTKRRCIPQIFGVTLIAVSRLGACANPRLALLRVAHTHVVLARNGRRGRRNNRARELAQLSPGSVALAPVPELSVVSVARLVVDDVVGDVLLAGRLHRLFHQDVRSQLQASRVASGWILRHERLMFLPPTCHVGFHVLDGQSFVCSRLPLACAHCVEAWVNVLPHDLVRILCIGVQAKVALESCSILTSDRWPLHELCVAKAEDLERKRDSQTRYHRRTHRNHTIELKKASDRLRRQLSVSVNLLIRALW